MQDANAVSYDRARARVAKLVAKVPAHLRLATARDALVAEGVDAVKVDRLAQRLGVTRACAVNRISNARPPGLAGHRAHAPPRASVPRLEQGAVPSAKQLLQPGGDFPGGES